MPPLMTFTDPDSEGARLLTEFRRLEQGRGAVARRPGEDHVGYLSRLWEATKACREARTSLLLFVRSHGPAEAPGLLARLDGTGSLRVFNTYREAPCSSTSSSPRSSPSPPR